MVRRRMFVLVSVLLLGCGGQVLAEEKVGSKSLAEIVAGVCEAIGNEVKAAAFTWPCESDLTGEAATEKCRERLATSVVDAAETALREAAVKQEAMLLQQWESPERPVEALPILTRLRGDLQAAAADAIERLKTRTDDRLAAVDLSAAEAPGAADASAKRLLAFTASDFAARCQSRLLPTVLGQLAASAAGRSDEQAPVKEPIEEQGKDGFSNMVHCQWQRVPNEVDRLQCDPGLRLSGEDVSGILILPPEGEGDFRLAWVQAVTAEEGFQRGQVLSCPGFGGADSRKLTCDELCYSAPTGSLGAALCAGARDRRLPVRSASIAVHKPRLFGTSYGCTLSRKKCAFGRLRGLPGSFPEREKLSLVLEGKSPYVLIHALDGQGRLATGRVLVGYERWRVETGGFLAVSPLVDEELVQARVGPEQTALIGGEEIAVGEGQVAMARVRESDDVSQETGIFANFIPSNYEAIGIGLGLASHDSGAPSIYLGPIMRLRSFGHRGLAAFSAGIVLREVDRFPDFEPGVYDADSSFLQPKTTFDTGWFFSVQLGFSFGSISVPGAKEEE